MQDESQQFERNDMWELVSRLDGVNVIGTEWVYRNKTEEHGKSHETRKD